MSAAEGLLGLPAATRPPPRCAALCCAGAALHRTSACPSISVMALPFRCYAVDYRWLCFAVGLGSSWEWVRNITAVANWSFLLPRVVLLQWSLSYTSLSCKSHSFVRPIGVVSFRILYMTLYGRLFSLERPSQFYVQIFESRLGRITENPLYPRGRLTLLTICIINMAMYFIVRGQTVNLLNVV